MAWNSSTSSTLTTRRPIPSPRWEHYESRCPPNVFLELLHKPSIKILVAQEPASEPGGSEPGSSDPRGSGAEETSSAHEIMAVILAWTEPILAYLLRDELHEDKEEARCIARPSHAYAPVNEELYKFSVIGVFQHCVSLKEGRKILQEVHAGVCGYHATPRTHISTAFRHGFFWLTAK